MPIQTIDRGTAGDTGDKFKIGEALDTCQANDNFLDAKIDTLDAYLVADLALKANITSPTFLVDPRAPTPALGDNDTSIATTAFVQAEFAAREIVVGPASATDNALAVFDGTSGILLKDGPLPTTAGTAFITVANPGAVTFPRVNADNSLTLRSAVNLKTDLSLENVDNTSDANKAVSNATQTALNLKANLASPTLTGSPAAPTAALGNSTTLIATTAYVQQELSGSLYPRSAAEIAAGVTPSNYRIPSDVIGITLQSRYSTYANANSVAEQAGIPSIGTGNGNVNTNVTFGRGSLASNTTGSLNIAIGRSALALSAAGDNNIAIGYNVLSAYVGATGSLQGQNTVVGSNSAYSVTTGGNNTVVGNNSFMDAVTANYCTALGQGALAYATNIDYSVGVGYHALLRCKAAGNVAVGAVALGSNGGVDLTGIANTAMGYFSLGSLTTGTTNVAVGYEAMQGATTAIDCVALGHGALYTNNASGLTAVGKSALVANTSGTGNTAVGRKALFTNATGAENTAVGENSLLVSTGPNSTAVGKNALQSLTSSGNCTGVGHSVFAVATGTANTGVGFEAGLGVTFGDSNTCLGFRADSTLTSQNSTSLGNTASCTGSNQVTLGNASIATLRCQQTSITALSDRRDKTDIEELELGLDFINAVKVRKFTWDRRDGSLSGKPEAGIIAQELQDLQKQFDADWLDMVLEVNPDRLEASPFKMFFPLLKAVQELSAKVSVLEALKDKNTAYGVASLTVNTSGSSCTPMGTAGEE
jgi:hypothetical protein